MKYYLFINSRATYEESYEEKHLKTINFLKKINGFLGIPQDKECPLPSFGTHFTAIMGLKGKMQNIRSGMLCYRFRAKLEDYHSSDDYMHVEFESKGKDFTSFVEIFKRYVIEYNAYSATVYPEDLIYIERPFTPTINLRKDLKEFYPVQFWDKTLIQHLFKSTPEELFDRLEGSVYKVELLGNGLLVQLDRDFVTVDEALSLSQKMQDVLGVKTPYLT